MIEIGLYWKRVPFVDVHFGIHFQISGRGQRRQYNLKRIRQTAAVERQDQAFAGLDLSNTVSSAQNTGEL